MARVRAYVGLFFSGLGSSFGKDFPSFLFSFCVSSPLVHGGDLPLVHGETKSVGMNDWGLAVHGLRVRWLQGLASFLLFMDRPIRLFHRDYSDNQKLRGRPFLTRQINLLDSKAEALRRPRTWIYVRPANPFGLGTTEPTSTQENPARPGLDHGVGGGGRNQGKQWFFFKSHARLVLCFVKSASP